MMFADMPILAQTLWERFWNPMYPFYRNALLGATAIALVSGVLSVFVVSRRMAFVGEGVSHSAFGGAGLAYLMGAFLTFFTRPLVLDLVIALFCVATALTIGRLSRRGRVSEDSAIGIVLVAAMSLGMLLLDLRGELQKTYAMPGGRPPIEEILFGNLMSVSYEEVWVAWGLAVVTLALIALFFKELLFFAFDSEGATVFGVPAAALHYGLLVVLAATIVLAMRLLGVILASAFLILPGTVALVWTRRMGRVLVLSCAVAVGSIFPSLIMSMWTNFTTGPVIVITLCAALGASYAIKNALRRKAA